jgi:hypothetical protein
VIISLVGIGSGLIVVYGFPTNKKLDRWTGVFLITTALTSLTGFLFPISKVTPGIILGMLSLVTLAIAFPARYRAHLAWRKTYVVTASIALYFNMFVLVAQSFQKVPELHRLAPTQTEPAFAVTQLFVLVAFVALTIAGVRNFRGEDRPARRVAARAA